MDSTIQVFSNIFHLVPTLVAIMARIYKGATCVGFETLELKSFNCNYTGVNLRAQKATSVAGGI
jgi:hypothetical protein